MHKSAAGSDAGNCCRASFVRAEQPRVGLEPALELPRFERAVLANGLTVLVSERHDLPVVSMNVAFAAGSASDPPDRAGLAALTYGLMLEGAGGRNAAQLDEAFAMLGDTPALQIQPDGARLSVTVMTERAPEALELLRQVVMSPALEEGAFEFRKRQQSADLAALASEPSFIAQRILLASAYGASHPYAHQPRGTRDTVARISFADARTFYARCVGPASMAVIATGDITLARARSLADALFGSWRSSATRPPAPPPVEPREGRPVCYAGLAGLNQTTLLIGRAALPAGDPQEAPLEIATAAIGGMFSSRLNLNLREEHGYTYGARAVLDARHGPGPWYAQAAVRADSTAAALNEVLEELKQLPLRPIRDSEAEAARHSLIVSLPGQFETAGDLSAAATQIFWYAQPTDRYAQLVAELRRATASDAEEAALLYLAPSLQSVVAVGDPSLLKAQLPRVAFNPARALEPWFIATRPAGEPAPAQADPGVH